MKKYLSYLAWNCILIGTLVAGYFLGVKQLAGIVIGITYGIMIPFYFIAVFAYQAKPEIKVMADKILAEWKWYYYPSEILFIALTVYMGYRKISLCEIIELSIVTYLFIKSKTKEVKE